MARGGAELRVTPTHGSVVRIGMLNVPRTDGVAQVSHEKAGESGQQGDGACPALLLGEQVHQRGQTLKRPGAKVRASNTAAASSHPNIVASCLTPWSNLLRTLASG